MTDELNRPSRESADPLRDTGEDGGTDDLEGALSGDRVDPEALLARAARLRARMTDVFVTDADLRRFIR